MRVIWPDWSMGRAIQAQKEIQCCGFNCTNIIKKGDFYTLHVLKSTGRYEKHPICFQCKPWKIDDSIKDSHNLFELWISKYPHTHDVNYKKYPEAYSSTFVYVPLKEENNVKTKK